MKTLKHNFFPAILAASLLAGCSGAVPSFSAARSAVPNDAAVHTVIPQSAATQSVPGSTVQSFPAPVGPANDISDDNVDSAIDATLPEKERAFMHEVLLSLPPAYRDNVVYRTADGQLHSNKSSLLQQAVAKEQQFANSPVANEMLAAPSARHLPPIAARQRISAAMEQRGGPGFSDIG